MSNYLSGFSSRVANLRQNLLATESDGQTIHETNIARVLRGYYTEQGRGFKPQGMRAIVEMDQRTGKEHTRVVVDDEKTRRLAIFTEEPQQAAYVPTNGASPYGNIQQRPGAARSTSDEPQRPIFSSPNPNVAPQAAAGSTTARRLGDKFAKQNRQPRNAAAPNLPDVRSNSFDNTASYNNQATYNQPTYNQPTYEQPNRPYPGASQQQYSQPNDFGGGYNAPPANNYGPPKNAGARRPAGGLPMGPKAGLPSGGPRGNRMGR
ncbi:hypothetical protein HYFRA_00001370 [Hymenoscyphus fraxineus]|uniref:Mso1 N-terminal domain-containing protein n=1 Tax=Hymenoscyphus fraxineus TaxID=746836 RepID=A0A9N9L9L3_9HELO|nr:hypothetical protein HYFRA_00001370 [Hymenoscyphus fraxineus]